MPPEAIRASAEGINELVDRVVVLTRIHVDYTLRLPDGAPRDKVNRALQTHAAKCPMAQTLKDSVEITWSADIS